MNGPHHLLGAFLQSAVCVVVVSRPSLLFFFFFNQILFLFSSVSRRRISSAILSLLDTMTSSVVSTKGFCPVKEECRGLLFLFNKEKIWLITRTKLATLSPFQLFTSSAVRPQQTTGRCEVSRHEILSTPWRSLLRLFHTSALSSWTLSSYSFLYST